MFIGCVVDSASSPQKALPLPGGFYEELTQVQLQRAVLVGGKEGVDTFVYVSVEGSPKVAISALRAKERPCDDFEVSLDLSLPFELSVEGPGRVHLSGTVLQCEGEEGDFDGKERRGSSSTSEGESGHDSDNGGENNSIKQQPAALSSAGKKKVHDSDDDDVSSGSDGEVASHKAKAGKACKATTGKALADESAEEASDDGDDDDGSGDEMGEHDDDDGSDAAESSSEDEKVKLKESSAAISQKQLRTGKAVIQPTQTADKKKRPVPDSPQPSPPAKKEKKVGFAAPAGNESGAETQLKETVVSYLKKNGACTIGQLGAKVPKPPALKNVKWGQFLKKFSCFKVDGQNVTLVN